MSTFRGDSDTILSNFSICRMIVFHFLISKYSFVLRRCVAGGDYSFGFAWWIVCR